MKRRLILVLGDQLTHVRAALADASPQHDVIVMAEVKEEASYVRHNQHKIALIFTAMRHFREELEAAGYSVIYFTFSAGVASLEDAVHRALVRCDVDTVTCCEPGEYRLLAAMRDWQLPVPLEIVADERFLTTHQEFSDWTEGRKSLRMEYFYRVVRRKYRLLMDDEDAPEGGQWNYDAKNRQGWRGKQLIPDRPVLQQDAITREVIELVKREFPDHPGNLDCFEYATNHEDAWQQFQWFLIHGLPNFGRYQDAMAEESPWLFHAVLSMYINIGLLDPLQVCREVEASYRAGRCELPAAEGFIRQVAGWREFVRGMYWLKMPEYQQLNALQANRPLPEWFWTGKTELRCLSQALQNSLELGYAHHIQRLMVIGNFCLLAGLDVREVCDWYLAVYADAFEWVELPNTLGMALHADGGLMASKPYAASGKYIQRQSNHCKECVYSPAIVTGEGACPFNSLYWRFIHGHEAQWKSNPRMSLSDRNWQRKESDEQEAILHWADTSLERLCHSARSLC